MIAVALFFGGDIAGDIAAALKNIFALFI